MNFNSLEYALFLLTVVALYWLATRSETARKLTLLVASYTFYMSWSQHYAVLIFFSTIVDYSIGRKLESTSSKKIRKTLLVTSLVTNLGLLFLFKYFNFFASSGEQIATAFGLPLETIRLELLLPVGISFYTFQTLSYTIDIFLGRLKAERSFISFAVFVAFFPQLVAGPIVRASEFLPQVRARPKITAGRFHDGVLRIFQGLIKKVVFADLLATLLIDKVFENPAEFGYFDRALALYGYAFQIYNDFSGYSDIAIGSAILLGYRLPENFNLPYLATNVREFWSRWHMSLSTWLRDYLYVPLGGNRKGKNRTSLNLMITMILGGLWHGAALNFVLWGVFHGLLLVVSHRSKPKRNYLLLRRLLCFHLICIGWLLFRVQSMDDLGAFLAPTTISAFRTSSLFLVLLGLSSIEHTIAPKRIAFARRFLAVRAPAFLLGTLYAALGLVIVSCSTGSSAFLYFQF